MSYDPCKTSYFVKLYCTAYFCVTKYASNLKIYQKKLKNVLTLSSCRSICKIDNFPSQTRLSCNSSRPLILQASRDFDTSSSTSPAARGFFLSFFAGSSGTCQVTNGPCLFFPPDRQTGLAHGRGVASSQFSKIQGLILRNEGVIARGRP